MDEQDGRVLGVPEGLDAEVDAVDLEELLAIGQLVGQDRNANLRPSKK
jgi:hypothetical protein